MLLANLHATGKDNFQLLLSGSINDAFSSLHTSMFEWKQVIFLLPVAPEGMPNLNKRLVTTLIQ